MNVSRMTPAELVRHVDNLPDATPLERALAEALDNTLPAAKEAYGRRAVQQVLPFDAVEATTRRWLGVV